MLLVCFYAKANKLKKYVLKEENVNCLLEENGIECLNTDVV